MQHGHHLPLFGVGPIYVLSIVFPTLVCVFEQDHPFFAQGKISLFPLLFPFVGGLCILFALWMWVQAVFVAKIDAHILQNHLVTSGIYAWVRHPVYSAFLLLCTGILLLLRNVYFFALPVMYWALLTILMKRTEEKWLIRQYGEEYLAYARQVNRCWPWFPQNAKR